MFNKSLLIVFLLPICCSAESLTVRLNLNGPTCHHIGVFDITGKQLFVTSIDEVSQPFLGSDSPIMIQIKDRFKSAPIKDEQNLKLLIESNPAFVISPFLNASQAIAGVSTAGVQTSGTPAP